MARNGTVAAPPGWLDGAGSARVISFDRAIRRALAEFEHNGCRVAAEPNRVCVAEPVGTIRLYHYSDGHILACLETFRLRPNWRPLQPDAPAADDDGLPAREAAEPTRLVSFLRDKLERLERKLESAERDRDLWRYNAQLAEEQLAALLGRASGESDDRFVRAKRAFAHLYHPDLVEAGDLERLIRGEIFREFWTVLEEIERSGERNSRGSTGSP